MRSSLHRPTSLNPNPVSSEIPSAISTALATSKATATRSYSGAQTPVAGYDYPSFSIVKQILDWRDLRSDSITRPTLIPARQWFGGSALDEVQMIPSTDHAGSTGASGLYVASASAPDGNWSWRTDKGTSGRIYQDAGANQTEMPTAYQLPDGRVVVTYVNQVSGGAYQDNKYVTTTDGFTCTPQGTLLAAPPAPLEAYGNYVGYLKVYRVAGGYVAVHNTGLGGNGPIALSYSVDGIQWVSDFEGIGPQSAFLSDQNTAVKVRNMEIFRWTGSPWALLAVSSITGGGGADQQPNDYYVAPLLPSWKGFAAAPVKLILPFQTGETWSWTSLTASTDVVYSSVAHNKAAPRTYTDATTTSGQAKLTITAADVASGNGGLTSGDIGAVLTSANYPAGTTILTVSADGLTAVTSAPASASSSGGATVTVTDTIVFGSVGATGGVTAGTTYYVKTTPNPANYSMTLSASAGGSTLDITSSGEGQWTPKGIDGNPQAYRHQQLSMLAFGSDLFAAYRVGGQQGRFWVMKLDR